MKRSILFRASWIWSVAVAYEQRMNPSPHFPKAVPGTQATFSASSSCIANSWDVSPNFEMSGNV